MKRFLAGALAALVLASGCVPAQPQPTTPAPVITFTPVAPATVDPAAAKAAIEICAHLRRTEQRRGDGRCEARVASLASFVREAINVACLAEAKTAAEATVCMGKAGAVDVKDASGATISMASTLIGGDEVAHNVIVDADGDVMPVLAAGADGIANTENQAQTAAGLYLFNGTTWDRARGDTANGQDVDVTRSALPTGAATAANQTTGNTSLSAIETDADTIASRTPALGQAAMAASSPVVIASNQSPVPMRPNDGTNAITLDTIAGSETTATIAMPMQAFMYGFDGGEWDRLTLNTVPGDDWANTTNRTPTISAGMLYDGTQWIRQRGTVAGGTLVTTAPGSVTTILSLGNTSADVDSSVFDASACSEVWFELEWVNGAADATGILSVWGGLTSSLTGAGIDVDDRHIEFSLDTSASPSFATHGENTCSVASGGEGDDGNAAITLTGADTPAFCQFIVPRSVPFLMVRYDATTGGSAGDLTIRAYCGPR